MDKAERADRIGIGQIAIEVRDLWREQQAFVDDGSTRQGRDVEEFFVFDVRLADLFFGELADDVKFALECVFVHFRWPTDENLLNVRLRRPRDAPDGIAIYWRIAPTEDGESLFADYALKHAFTVQARMLLYRQECHADRVLSRLGQSNAKRFTLAHEKLVRNLNQHAGTVAGFGIAPAGAAVSQVDEDLNSLLDDLMALVSTNAGDEAHAAGIVLVRRVIKTLRRRQAVSCLPVLQMTPKGRASHAVGRARNLNL